MSLVEKLNSVKTRVNNLENAINSSGVLDITDGTVTDKVNLLIEKAQNSGTSGKPYVDTRLITHWDGFFQNGQNMSVLEYADMSNGVSFKNLFNNNQQLTECPVIDVSNGESFDFMFNRCINLLTVPKLNTSKGTTFEDMFRECTKVENIPPFDTSNATNLKGIFKSCYKRVPDIDTSNATNLSQAFASANIEEFRGNVEKATNVGEMFRTNTKIKYVGEFKAVSVSTFWYLFDGCTSLETVELMQIGENAQNATNSFNNCKALKNIRFVPNTTKVSIAFAQSSKLTTESVQSIFDGLATVTTAQTLTLNANTKILQSQVDAANAKGWTVAGGTIVSEDEYYG